MKLGLLATAATALLTGCSEGKPRTLGTAVEGAAVRISAAQLANANSSLVVQGQMVKKCPVAGCWFILQDESGTIRVDTKDAGFVVVDVPVNSRLTVAGRVSTNGEERVLEATGVRY